MRLLVIGESGQLARALARESGICVGRNAFNLAGASTDDATALLHAHQPDAVINASAYTSVDNAETEAEAAYALNQAGPRVLAAACARAATPMVHVSTDYVFNGHKSSPYVETDSTDPQSVYGASKAAGEVAVQDSGARAAIVRTSWVYGSEGENFVRTMLRLAETRDETRVVSDQRGSPTWAADLATACRALAERLLARDAAAEGLFHFAGSGETTWADFAATVFEGARARGWPAASVKCITTAEFPTAAKRPANSSLDCTKYALLIGPPRPWREALALCMSEMTRP